LADFGVESGAFALEVLCLGPADAWAKNAGGAFDHDFFPIGNLRGMDFEILGDLLDGLNALERFKGYTGFEFWVVSFSFGFHFVCVRFG